MDRSFLSRPEVIRASRKFVCIRLATYENAEEAKMLEKIFVGPSGALENTVFALLAPDGKTLLSAAGRGPHFAFASPAEMAAQMQGLATKYQAATTLVSTQIPYVKGVRLAINVAACDRLPVLVLAGSNREQLERLEKAVRPLAWKQRLQGQVIFTSTSDPDEMRGLGGPGIYLLDPEPFGRHGKILKRFTSSDVAAGLPGAVTAYHRPVKVYQQHVSEGRQEGVYWQTAIPVTDPHSRGP